MFKRLDTDRNLQIIKQNFYDSNINEIKKLESSNTNSNLSFMAKLAKSIISVTAPVKKMINNIVSISTKFSAFNLKLNFYGKELNDTSNALKNSADNLSDIASESSTSMEEFTASLSNNSIALDDLSQKTNSLKDVLQEEEDVVKDIVSVNKEISSVSSVIEKNNLELSDIISNMRSILSGINGIAKNTNLLALNASIEAARAGENGKGFVVVAEEVKKLSENTTEELKLIESFINRIEHTAKDNSKNMENALSSISKLDKCTDRISGSFEKNNIAISSMIEDINSISYNIQQISSIAEELNANIDTVSANAVDLSKISHVVNDKSNFIISISKELSEIEDNISTISSIGGTISNEEFFNLPNEYFINNVNLAINAHKKWIDDLDNMASKMELSPIQLNHLKCGFGHFYHALTPCNEDILKIWKELDNIHQELHNSGKYVIEEIKKGNSTLAKKHLSTSRDLSQIVIEKLNKIKLLSETLTKENKNIF